MKKLIVFLMLFMIVPGFGAYKLVLKNGAVLELTKEPDLAGKQVIAETVKGKKIIFPVRFVDKVATKKANLKKKTPEKSVKQVKERVSEPGFNSPSSIPVPKTRAGRVPLVITNETVKKDLGDKPAAEETADSTATDLARQEKARATDASLAGEGSDGPEGPTDDKGRTEEYWHGKFQTNRELQAGVLKDLKKMQLKMNSMTSRRLQTDDELEKRSLTGKIQDLQKKIDDAKMRLNKLKEDKKKLLEEARTSGALPGWYRDYED